jgi:hypothetical protein
MLPKTETTEDRDRFLSLIHNGWLDFSPSTLGEYAQRYLTFLDDLHGVPRFRYEDFLADPQQIIQAMCAALKLTYKEGFEHLFSVHKLSGDSGRSSARIGQRPRRPVSDALTRQAAESLAYRELCERLGYAPL